GAVADADAVGRIGQQQAVRGGRPVGAESGLPELDPILHARARRVRSRRIDRARIAVRAADAAVAPVGRVAGRPAVVVAGPPDAGARGIHAGGPAIGVVAVPVLEGIGPRPSFRAGDV